MSLYVEIMCDERKEWPKGSGQYYNRCVTDRGNNPQGPTVVEARKVARAQGWILRRGNYACCPACQEPTQ